MILSTFLAKLLGLYFIIITLLWIFRPKQIIQATRTVATSRGLLAISAEFSLIFGLVIAVDHPVWEWSWRGLVTLIGYLLILRGIARLAFPAQVQKYVSKMLRSKTWIVFLAIFILGLYLTYCGFTFHPD